MNDPRSQRPLTRDEYRAIWILLGIVIGVVLIVALAAIGLCAVAFR